MSEMPNAPTAAEVGEDLFEHKGWPPDRANSMAVSAFIGHQRLVLNRLRSGEAIQLTQRNTPVAVLVPVAQYAALLAARRGEERAIMEAIELTVKAIEEQENNGLPREAQAIDYAGILRAALAATQEGK